MPDGTARRRQASDLNRGGPVQWTDDDAATRFYEWDADADTAKFRWGGKDAASRASARARPVAPASALGREAARPGPAPTSQAQRATLGREVARPGPATPLQANHPPTPNPNHPPIPRPVSRVQTWPQLAAAARPAPMQPRGPYASPRSVARQAPYVAVARAPGYLPAGDFARLVRGRRQSDGTWFWIAMVSMAVAALVAWVSLTVAGPKPAGAPTGSAEDGSAPHPDGLIAAPASTTLREAAVVSPGVALAPPPRARQAGLSAARATARLRAVASPAHPSWQRSAPAAAPSRPARGTRAADVSAGHGALRVNSLPWSDIYIDGSKVGTTPQLRLVLEPGRHKIKLVNPELGLMKGFGVEIKAGKTLTRVIQLY